MITRFKYFFVFVFFMFVLPGLSSAECDYERQAELSRIASNVQLSYSYNNNVDGVPVFVVDISNITNDIYVVDQFYDQFYTDSSKEYSSGSSIKFSIYSRDDSCSQKMLGSKYITIPSYNRYSNDARCLGALGFKYCNVWENTDNISVQDFDASFEKYEKEKNKKVSVKQVDKDNFFTAWIINNLTIIIVVLVLIVGLLVFAFISRRRY